MKLCLVFPYL